MIETHLITLFTGQELTTKSKNTLKFEIDVRQAFLYVEAKNAEKVITHIAKNYLPVVFFP